jgi:MYXO-CTERM domain-containing protein
MSRTALAWSIPLLLASTSVADAHFILMSPASRTEQDFVGSPQKSAPCGLTDSAGDPDESTPTGDITTVQTGSTLTITIKEAIFHPGHYRVALAADPASLPADPPVTPGDTACGSTTIAANPSLPVLADGLLLHTSNPGGVIQTMQVQLPAGMTCTNCVLQVTQFMSDHPLNNPGGCFYHHCAALTIADDAPPPVDAGDVPADPEGDDPGGCCQSAGGGAASLPAALALAALVGVVLLRRRRI